ncbi:MAG TPA: 16S rRNA (adenine(1518)-N(6)/adenine(1519)-N(6))-dimethyltransferase RsmA [bacterium]|nr:16S rRNA (adenine(1518)-N(6)/adenine(1519)-N(6))-dimethyltransferase RsmA [bacterium]
MSPARLPVDRAAAQAAGFWTKKRLGQHLLRDPQVVEETLAALAVKPDEALLEIGPGLGALTVALLSAGVPLLAVEVDPAACRALQFKFAGEGRFHLLEADVLKTDLARETARVLGGRPFHVAANLPYYITTPVLAHLLESRLPFGRMVVLTQWEVAQRLTASPDTKDWSALSALAHYFCRVTLLRKVLRGAFTPVPRVDSGLVLFERLPKPAVAVKNEKLYFRLVRSGFGMRRKTLRKALLMADLGLEAPTLEAALLASGVDGQRRGETLSLPEWARLADALS